MTGITLEKGVYGRRAVLNSEWATGMDKYINGNGIVELELNQAKGWKGSDLSFLTALRSLRLFEIFDLNIKDVSPIHQLGDLKRLGVTTYCSTEISFSAFPFLESCGLEWRPKARSLFECKTLTKLFVNRYSGKNVDPFAQLTNLESLSILNAPVENLHGLKDLRKLKSLRLANLKKLSSLKGIEGLTGLKELDINTCRRIDSIEEVAHLLRLRKIHLTNDGDIRSLKPLQNLTGLEWVTFVQSTNILDGDISPLMEKNLSRVSFKNRPHYSHKREEFGAAFPT